MAMGSANVTINFSHTLPYLPILASSLTLFIPFAAPLRAGGARSRGAMTFSISSSLLPLTWWARAVIRPPTVLACLARRLRLARQRACFSAFVNNPDAFGAWLESRPESENIEDRRTHDATMHTTGKGGF
jgi:hypothetical protein